MQGKLSNSVDDTMFWFWFWFWFWF